jgi:hypothetical protein
MRVSYCKSIVPNYQFASSARGIHKDSVGRLFHDRDYHVHLGGAIPPWLVGKWIDDNELSIDDVIPDLVGSSNNMINVRDALIGYRYHPVDIPISKEKFLLAYNTPNYSDLPTFLTMYRAYSKRHLLHKYAATIAEGKYMHPYADVRVSLPVPYDQLTNERQESPYEYAKRAMKEMLHFRDSLLPSQQLFVTVPRQTFNKYKNEDYFNSFVDLLAEMFGNSTDCPLALPMSKNQEPAFDFAGQPLPLSLTEDLLSKLRSNFPQSLICYHHGEVCPDISFNDRVKDTLKLLPYVNRIGHGLCLGLAALSLHSEANGVLKDVSTVGKTVLDTNREIAFQCLHQMAALNIAVEVSPTCNITLGGACNTQVLKKYVKIFLEAGVDVLVGTDDPGFLNTTLEKERNILRDVLCTQ